MFEIKETPKTPSSNESVWKIEIAMHQRRTYLTRNRSYDREDRPFS